MLAYEGKSYAPDKITVVESSMNLNINKKIVSPVIDFNAHVDVKKPETMHIDS